MPAKRIANLYVLLAEPAQWEVAFKGG